MSLALSPHTKALADSHSQGYTERTLTLSDGSIYVHAVGPLSWVDQYRYSQTQTKGIQ